IDADCVRAEIAHVEQSVVGGDDAAHRTVADQVAAANLVGARLHDGETVALEVAGEQLAAIWLKRKLNRQLAHVEKGQQPVRFQIDRRELVRAGTCHERLAVVGKNDNVLRLLADGNSAAHRKLVNVNNGDSIVGAIADDHELAIGRNLRQTRRAADTDCCYHRPLGKVDDRNISRAGVGNVGARAISGDRDKVRSAMNPNGCDYFITFGVNDADVIGLGVSNVDFIALGIGGDAGGACAYGNG